MGKYLFFDIDGTLLGKSRRITEKTKQEKMGIRFLYVQEECLHSLWEM